ncbi:MAG: YqgE/AlgH family protein [Alteromonadaceae bacterium]|nr:MAG: YqgE/AlgH family protein [Alteromonadaceae bacterium]
MTELDPTPSSGDNLSGHFLIAMPNLVDSIFSHSVTYICDHNEHGAMGIVINQTLEATYDDVFKQLSLDPAAQVNTDTPVLAGGPVNPQQGFVLHRNEGKWDSTLQVSEEICLTTSRDIVAALANDCAPAGAQFALGYAGWSAGQLEEELSANSWLTVPANSSIIFDTPVQERWNAASKHIGVDLNLICSQAGHA